MAFNLAEQIALKQIDSSHYVSKNLPQRMGNSAPIAYGGYAVALAIHAACKTAPSGFHLYSALGHYLGPTSTDRHLVCSVQETRNTRTFATRRVQVSQEQANGKPRICLELLADFQVKEPPLLVYSTKPSRKQLARLSDLGFSPTKSSGFWQDLQNRIENIRQILCSFKRTMQ